MEWAKVLRKKNLAHWKKVVFTHESKIKISGSDGRVYIQRKLTEGWLPCYTLLISNCMIRHKRDHPIFSLLISLVKCTEKQDNCFECKDELKIFYTCSI